MAGQGSRRALPGVMALGLAAAAVVLAARSEGISPRAVTSMHAAGAAAVLPPPAVESGLRISFPDLGSPTGAAPVIAVAVLVALLALRGLPRRRFVLAAPTARRRAPPLA